MAHHRCIPIGLMHLPDGFGFFFFFYLFCFVLFLLLFQSVESLQCRKALTCQLI